MPAWALYVRTQELGLVMPPLPEARPLSLGGGSSGRVGGGEGAGAQQQPAKLATAVPASEEAKKSLRALKAAEG